MDRARFEAILEAYGADPQRWPEAERAEARAFTAAHSELAAALADAGRLDAMLKAGHGPLQGVDLLAARIVAAYPKASAPQSNRGWVLALAACAVFGVVIGFGGGMLAPQKAQSADAALTAAFGESWQQADANGGEG